MTCCQEIRTKVPGLSQEQLELEPLVAAHARIRCAADKIFPDKILDDKLLKFLFKIDDIEWYLQLFRHPPSIMNIVNGTAGAEGFFAFVLEGAMIPKLHGDADHIIPFILQKSCCDRRIYPAAHGDHYPFFAV